MNSNRYSNNPFENQACILDIIEEVKFQQAKTNTDLGNGFEYTREIHNALKNDEDISNLIK